MINIDYDKLYKYALFGVFFVVFPLMLIVSIVKGYILGMIFFGLMTIVDVALIFNAGPWMTRKIVELNLKITKMK